MSSVIQGAEGVNQTEGQMPANGYISNNANQKQPLKIPGTSAGGPVKENQSNNITQFQNHMQFQHRRIGTGQKIIESNKPGAIPSSSGERRQVQQARQQAFQGGGGAVMRGPAGYTDIIDVVSLNPGLQHQRSGIPRPTKFLINDVNQINIHNTNQYTTNAVSQKHSQVDVRNLANMQPVASQLNVGSNGNVSTKNQRNKYLDGHSNKLKMAGAQSLQRNIHIGGSVVGQPNYIENREQSNKSDLNHYNQAQNSKAQRESLVVPLQIQNSGDLSAQQSNRLQQKLPNTQLTIQGNKEQRTIQRNYSRGKAERDSTSIDYGTQAATNNLAINCHNNQSQVQIQASNNPLYTNTSTRQQKVQTQIKRLSRKQQEANELAEGVKNDVTNAARYVMQVGNSIEAKRKEDLEKLQKLKTPFSAIHEDDYVQSSVASDGESPKKGKLALQGQPRRGSRANGLINSHSNKRLPTDKETSLQYEFSKMQHLADGRGGIADRSLDRGKAQNFFNGVRDVFQSRQELLQNEYKKVIENYPSTLISKDKYDDTDFLNQMFAKDKQNILEAHGKKGQDDLLKNSDSVKLLNKKGKRSDSIESHKIMQNRLRTDEPKKDKLNDSSDSQHNKINFKAGDIKPTSMFQLMGDKPSYLEDQPSLLMDDDVRKLERLQLINASARYELLTANQQLIDFHLNRVMKAKFDSKKVVKNRIGVDTIGEVNENEESNEKLALDLSQNFPASGVVSARIQASFPKIAEMTDAKTRSKGGNIYSMETPLIQKDLDKRIQQMQYPHQVMQQRLNEMSPLMFGDTIRLPMFNIQSNSKLN